MKSQSLKKGSCAICKTQAEVKSLPQIQESLQVCGQNFSKRKILKNILRASKIIKEKQTRFLELETQFVKKFCSACLEKYSSPLLFKECQHKSCQNHQISKTSLKPDLELYEKLAPKKFKLCKLQPLYRIAKLDEVEKRLLYSNIGKYKENQWA